MKVNNDIGLFQKLSASLAKQRTDGKSTTSSSSTASTSTPNFLKSLEDKIDISSSFKPTSDVQTLTSEMRKKSFSSIKEYGAYFLETVLRIKANKS